MSEATVPVVAVVVASRGGSRLTTALDAVAWARERVVLDPLARIDPAQLPSGVAHHRDSVAVEAMGAAPWVLLLRDDEVAPPALRDAVAAAIVVGEPRGVRRELHALGVVFAVGGAPIRLAARAGSRIDVRRGIDLRLCTRGVRAPLEPLEPALVVAHAESLEAALEALDADSATTAALLDLGGRTARLRDLLWAPWMAGGRVLFARVPRPVGLARWVVAVLVGYGAVVAHAKLWERVRNRPLRIA
jgi:hypothetical protein